MPINFTKSPSPEEDVNRGDPDIVSVDIDFIRGELWWVFGLTVGACGAATISFAGALSALKYDGLIFVAGLCISPGFLVAAIMMVHGAKKSMNAIISLVRQERRSSGGAEEGLGRPSSAHADKGVER